MSSGWFNSTEPEASKNCICPGESYGCEVTFARKINWKTSIYENDGLFAKYTISDVDDKETYY